MVSHGFAKAATFGLCAFESRPLRQVVLVRQIRLAALACRANCPCDTLGVRIPRPAPRVCSHGGIGRRGRLKIGCRKA